MKTVAAAAVTMLVGCLSGGDFPSELPCPPEGEQRFAVTMFDLGDIHPSGDPTMVPGFDLDGRVSTDMDAAGCNHVDFSWPTTGTGVDNQLGPMLSGLGCGCWLTDPSCTVLDGGPCPDGPVESRELPIDLVMRPAGATVELEVVVAGESHVASVDDADCPDVAARLPEGIRLPLVIRGAFVDLPLARGRLALSFGSDSVTGIIGGAISRADAMRVTEITPGFAPEHWDMILDGQADLDPDETGVCQSVSIAWTFTAVPLP